MEGLTQNETPEDPRKWVSATQAAAMLQLSRDRVMRLATERGIVKRKARQNAEPYYLRREVESWVDLLSLRRQWLARHKEPRCEKRWTEKIDKETAQRLFISSDQAAVILGVTRNTVISLVRLGRLPCYQIEPGRKGARLWFSRRAVRQLAEDPKHQKRRENYFKRGNSDKSNKQGKIPVARMVKGGVPKGWLTVREAALRMGVSPQCVLQIRNSGHLQGEKIWRRNKPLRYWYFPDYEIERYISLRQQVKELAGLPPLPIPTAANEPPPSSDPPAPASEERKKAAPAPSPSPFRLDADSPEPKWACDDVNLTRAFYLQGKSEY